MSNLTEQDRNQYERATLRDTSTPVRSLAGRRALTAFVGIGLIVLAVLSYAAYQVFDGWPHIIVLGDLVLIFFGLAAWVYPQRKRT
jgi:hypothetical protein